MTLQIKNNDMASVLRQVHRGIEDHSQVELEFVQRPSPKKFKNILEILDDSLPKNSWFLSEPDSIIAGVLFGLNFSRPRRAVIEIANGCNLKCDFCWTHSPLMTNKPSAQWLKKTLDTEVIRDYIDELYEFGTVRLIELCAIGDPLYHPDIWELIHYIKKKNFQLRLSTNGTLLLPSRWEKYCTDPIDQLFMNISSGDRDSYAAIHNVSPTIYDQLITNLKHINADRKQREKKMNMRWINIITDKNITNIPNIIDAGMECGADYFDFRYVWIHQEFQHRIGISKNTLENLEPMMLKAQQKLKETGVRNNFTEFYKSIYAMGTQ